MIALFSSFYLNSYSKRDFVTCGGKKFSAAKFEKEIMSSVSVISACAVVGDKRASGVLLVSLKTEPNSNKLAPACLSVGKELNSPCSTVEEVVGNSAWKMYFEKALANSCGKVKANVKHFQIVPDGFPLETHSKGKVDRRKAAKVFSSALAKFD